jgi:hypothetical protein
MMIRNRKSVALFSARPARNGVAFLAVNADLYAVIDRVGDPTLRDTEQQYLGTASRVGCSAANSEEVAAIGGGHERTGDNLWGEGALPDR